MTQYDNTNRGVLFKNDRREQDSHPHYRGSINVGGEEFWLSAWLKESEKGKFMSLSVKPKDEAPKQAAPKKAAAKSEVPNDEIPFADPYKGRKANAI